MCVGVLAYEVQARVVPRNVIVQLPAHEPNDQAPEDPPDGNSRQSSEPAKGYPRMRRSFACGS
jgi:hypothetical protein